MTSSRCALVSLALVAAGLPALVAAGASPAAAADEWSPPDPYTLRDGVTQPVHSYADAIRETVYVLAPDADGDGEQDRVAADIVRPVETDRAGVDVPVVMDASPYYLSLGRGNEAEKKTYAADGSPQLLPLFYDNYFVPRGYGYVAVDSAGTGRSTGCVDQGGVSDVGSTKAVVDWLNGNASAVDADGEPVLADWTNGKTGMIGKSYDGTLANGVAALGTEGLETIVPIGAISPGTTTRARRTCRSAGTTPAGSPSGSPRTARRTSTAPRRTTGCRRRTTMRPAATTASGPSGTTATGRSPTPIRSRPASSSSTACRTSTSRPTTSRSGGSDSARPA